MVSYLQTYLLHLACNSPIYSFLCQAELVLDPYPACIHCMSYNHNGTLLVTGGADGMIRLFGMQSFTVAFSYILSSFCHLYGSNHVRQSCEERACFGDNHGLIRSVRFVVFYLPVSINYFHCLLCLQLRRFSWT